MKGSSNKFHVMLTPQDVGKKVIFNAGNFVGEILEYVARKNAYAVSEAKGIISLFDTKGRFKANKRFKIQTIDTGNR